MMEIRFLAETDDLYAVSRIYEESWKVAYRGIMPDAYLQALVPGRWVPLLQQERRSTLLVLDGGKMVGTASYGPSRWKKWPDYGEIFSIYLLPTYTGQGYGTALLQTVLAQLTRASYQDILLWVLESNEAARRFYETFGFRTNGKYIQEVFGGKVLKEVQYCWHVA